MTANCNCMVVWNPLTERREWVHAILSNCDHPATGEPARIEAEPPTVAVAWDAGYRQALVALGSVPDGDDPMRYGPPAEGPHANPYRKDVE